MARYQFTTQDRSKGGKTTASRYDMQARGRGGLKALADKYFNGDIKKAGEGLSRIGNAILDPFPANRAWTNHRIFEMPSEFLAAVWGHCETDFDPLSDDSPF